MASTDRILQILQLNADKAGQEAATIGGKMESLTQNIASLNQSQATDHQDCQQRALPAKILTTMAERRETLNHAIERSLPELEQLKHAQKKQQQKWLEENRRLGIFADKARYRSAQLQGKHEQADCDEVASRMRLGLAIGTTEEGG